MGLNKETNEWSRKEVKRFSTAIKRLIKHNYNQERKQSRQIIKKTPSEDYFERNTREVTHYVAIDSRDRDRKIWPNSNEFRITFAPSSGAIFDNKDGLFKTSIKVETSTLCVSPTFEKSLFFVIESLSFLIGSEIKSAKSPLKIGLFIL